MIRLKKNRYFRPLKSLRQKDFYVYDTETGFYFTDKDGTRKIKFELWARPETYIFGVLYGIENGKEFIKLFRSPDEAKKEFMKRKYKNKIIYAHNGEYDYTATYGNIYEVDSDAIFNGKFICATNGNTMFGDSYNLLQTSVEKLGKLVGIPKQQLGENYTITRLQINDAINYCITDCKIVYVALTRIFEDAQPCLTIGSLSLKLFRHNFLDRVWDISNLSDEFFKAYYGGRTEAFYLGHTDANVFDINSAYPWAMRNASFPNPETLQKKSISKNDLNYYLDHYEGMVSCTIEYKKDMHIPVLPFRTPDKLLFPNGKFYGSWCFNEIRYALQYVNIVSDCEIVYASRIESPFKEFIDYYYNLRDNTTDDFERYYYKLFMNNLYGKLVQRINEKYIFVTDQSRVKQLMNKHNSKWAELITVDGGYFLKMKLPESFTSHTIACWGAYITADVRILLHQTMQPIAKSVLYCDTDSTITTKAIPQQFIGSKLGQWKQETYKVKKINSLKDYEIIEPDGSVKRKLKGVKKDSERLPDTPKGEEVYLVKKMIKTKESYKRLDKLPPGVFFTMKKIISGDYDKRIVLKNGTTKAIKL